MVRQLLHLDGVGDDGMSGTLERLNRHGDSLEGGVGEACVPAFLNPRPPQAAQPHESSGGGGHAGGGPPTPPSRRFPWGVSPQTGELLDPQAFYCWILWRSDVCDIPPEIFFRRGISR